jgi:hypothetical protein
MAVGIIWNLASLALMAYMFPSFQTPKIPAGTPDINSFKNIIVGFNVVFMLGLSGVFAWIIKRLCSESISAEFI